MALALVAFTAVFLLIASGLLLMFYRDTTLRRIEDVVSPRPAGPGMLDRILRLKTPTAVESMIQPFQKVMPRSTADVSVIQKRLIRAGYRQDSYVNIFYGAKVLTPLALVILATVTHAYDYGPFFVYALAAALGFLAPDFWLGMQISKRQTNIRIGLPEALDLLVICVEAGLGLDQAIMRVAEELKLSQPEICDEFGLIVLEQRAGRPRSEAWKNLGERTDVDTVRAMVATLIQADHFGTSVSKTLRVYSDNLRVQRRQQVEEQAAKTTVKLVFPLVIFIFPSLFVVALGPAIITMLEGLHNIFS